MSFRALVVLVVLWLTSLFAVGTLARAQLYGFEPLPEPIVLSGSDIAYRVEGWLGHEPAGRLVIRVNGQWVVPQPTPGTLVPRPVR